MSLLFSHRLQSSIVITLLTSSSSLYAGGMDAGGASWSTHKENAAWFIGEKLIRTCVDRDEGFSVEPNKVEAVIKLASQKWDQKIRQVFKEPSTPKIQAKIKWLGKCQDFPDSDLKIVLGSKRSWMPTSLLEASSSIVGHAQPLERTEEHDWAKGFIYIAESGFKNDSEKSFTALMLHEWGHMLGMPHLNHTIMDEQIALNALGSVWPNSFSLAQRQSIDHEHTLVPLHKNPIQSLEDPEGKKTVRYIPLKDDPGGYKIQLNVTKFETESNYVFQPQHVLWPGLDKSISTDMLFFTFTKDLVSNGFTFTSNSFESLQMTGSITTEGQKFPATFTHNINGRQQLLQMFVEGRWKTLFEKIQARN